MKRFATIFFSAAAALLVLCPPQARAQKRVRLENEKLRLEMSALKARLDSVQAQNTSLAATLDSLVNQAAVDESQIVSDYELSDSLLHNWMIQQNSKDLAEGVSDTVTFRSDVPDEVFMQRLADMNSYINLPYNDIVKNFCILYSEKMPSQMARMMGLAEYYWPIFDEILTHYGVPLELKYLVVVESKLNPRATSRVGAKGLWQFMYTTGKGYGLRIDSWQDERMDPVKSTVAAAKYLRDAYNVFGDWSLAIASYNCGAGNVQKAIKRSGGKKDFWQIYEYLPRETRSYVPAFVGAMYAFHYYREYAINPVKSSLVVPVDTMHIHRGLHFEQVSALTGVSTQMLSDLNPQYVHSLVPADNREHVIRIPMAATSSFIAAGDSLYNHQRDKYFNPIELKKLEESSAYGPAGSKRKVYVVKSGDVLGKIASRHGVTVAQIMKWNGLKSNVIRIGQKLVIYTKR